MFAELTEELMELTVAEKGYRSALYAQNDNDGGCSSCASSSSLTCSSLCW